jgi:hypothetical protein
MAYDYDRRTASSEVSLRKAIIRLAHAKPELREHLLPLVRQANPDSHTVMHVRHRDTPKMFKFMNTAAARFGGEVLQSGNYPSATSVEIDGKSINGKSTVSIPSHKEKMFMRFLRNIFPKGWVSFPTR